MSDLKPRMPTIDNHGLFAFHDQACAVLHEESAVYNCNVGVFEPSWKAQAKGWYLVHAQNWLDRLALKVLQRAAP